MTGNIASLLMFSAAAYVLSKKLREKLIERGKEGGGGEREGRIA